MYRSLKIWNRRFIGAKMEALLTLTRWLGKCCKKVGGGWVGCEPLSRSPPDRVGLAEYEEGGGALLLLVELSLLGHLSPRAVETSRRGRIIFFYRSSSSAKYGRVVVPPPSSSSSSSSWWWKGCPPSLLPPALTESAWRQAGSCRWWGGRRREKW